MGESSETPLRYSTKRLSDVTSLVDAEASSIRRSVFLRVREDMALLSKVVEMKYSMPSTARKTG